MSDSKTEIIDVIDSHTGGEPTRIVMAGGPDLGPGPIGERLKRLREFHAGARNGGRGS